MTSYELKRELIAPDTELVMSVTFGYCGPAGVESASFHISVIEKGAELPYAQAVILKSEKSAVKVFDFAKALVQRVLVE